MGSQLERQESASAITVREETDPMQHSPSPSPYEDVIESLWITLLRHSQDVVLLLKCKVDLLPKSGIDLFTCHAVYPSIGEDSRMAGT